MSMDEWPCLPCIIVGLNALHRERLYIASSKWSGTAHCQSWKNISQLIARVKNISQLIARAEKYFLLPFFGAVFKQWHPTFFQRINLFNGMFNVAKHFTLCKLIDFATELVKLVGSSQQIEHKSEVGSESREICERDCVHIIHVSGLIQGCSTWAIL